ncbi:MAG: hypothetical protein IKP61_09630 [Spirochaetales bacterium]|nr:hypothetical protein [Spirochaetales bacterium]
MLLLFWFPCLWADGQTLTESYTEPTSFRIRWSVTNTEDSSWVVQEYDETNPIIVNNTITLNTTDLLNDYQHVCKVIFTSNKSGYHDFYCNAIPFKVQSGENEPYTTAGYTLRFSFGEEPDVTRYYYVVDSNIDESRPAYFQLPLSVDCLSSKNGYASQAFYVDILLSDWDSMGMGTNVAQLCFIKETI